MSSSSIPSRPRAAGDDVAGQAQVDGEQRAIPPLGLAELLGPEHGCRHVQRRDEHVRLGDQRGKLVEVRHPDDAPAGTPSIPVVVARRGPLDGALRSRALSATTTTSSGRSPSGRPRRAPTTPEPMSPAPATTTQLPAQTLPPAVTRPAGPPRGRTTSCPGRPRSRTAPACRSGRHGGTGLRARDRTCARRGPAARTVGPGRAPRSPRAPPTRGPPPREQVRRDVVVEADVPRSARSTVVEPPRPATNAWISSTASWNRSTTA